MDTDMKSNFSDMSTDINSYRSPYRCSSFAVLSCSPVDQSAHTKLEHKPDSLHSPTNPVRFQFQWTKSQLEGSRSKGSFVFGVIQRFLQLQWHRFWKLRWIATLFGMLLAVVNEFSKWWRVVGYYVWTNHNWPFSKLLTSQHKVISALKLSTHHTAA
jgi:hypothetical protein